MPRKSTIDDRAVFAHLAEELLEAGSLRLESLSRRAGVSIGSIYHRYGSREGLMAQAWITAVGQFQDGFVARLQSADLAGGLQAALEVPRYCRRAPGMAAILVCCRQSEFIGPTTPDELKSQVASINNRPAEELEKFARRVERPALACQLAMVAWPVAAVRMFLPHREVPAVVDDYISATYRTTLIDSVDHRL